MDDKSENQFDMSGQDFRLKRRQIGMTQQRLADILECSRQHIVTLEAMHTVPVVWAMAMDTLHRTKLAEYAAA